MSIWEHKEIKKSLNAENSLGAQTDYISLNEGNTPLEEYEYDSNKVFLKREDKNPTGSWKDRGTAYKITQLIHQNTHEAVISSSGNAAISFLTYANKIGNFKMNIVVSPDVNPEKRKILEDLKGEQHEIYYEKQAKKKSVQIANEKKIPLLRASTDNDIVKGYWSLGFELAKTIQYNQSADNYIFISASSGTAAVGMAEGLFAKLGEESKMPKIFICQTSSCHPLASINLEITEDSLADAIVDKSLLRKPQLEKIIKQTGGEALIISNEELEIAKDLVKETFGQDLSYTSLLPVAGYLKLNSDINNSNIICITSGR